MDASEQVMQRVTILERLVQEQQEESAKVCQEIAALREDYAVLQDCLFSVGVVRKKSFENMSSYRRSVVSQKAILQLHGAVLAIGTSAGYLSTCDWRIASRCHNAAIHPMLPSIASICPPQMIVVGGCESNSTWDGPVEAFDPATSAWKVLGRRVTGPTIKAAAAQGYLYTFREEIRHVISERFDPKTGVWTTLPDMPQQRTHFALAACRGRLCIAGGVCCQSMQALSRSSNSVIEFNPTTGAWVVLPPMPTSRQDAVAASVGCKFYVIGGLFRATGMRICGQQVCGVECFDYGNRTWDQLATLPIQSLGYSAAGCGGSLYVLVPDTVGTCLRLETATRTWTTLPALPTPRNSCAVSSLAGRLYVLGGRAIGGPGLGIVETYDVAAGSWTQLPSMQAGRAGCAAAAMWV